MKTKTNRKSPFKHVEQKRALLAAQELMPKIIPDLIQAYTGRSLRSAIKAKCADCCEYDAARLDCKTPWCPLYRHKLRPETLKS